MIDYDIVIIDSGVNLNDNSNLSGFSIEKSHEQVLFTNNLSDEIGHGTIIYSIIRNQVVDARIFIIKLSENEENYDDSCLVRALEYIKDNIKCKVVNISLGIVSSDNLGKLYDVCAAIAKKGIVLVSAFDNGGCYSYPAAFDCVIGVDSKNHLNNINEFDYVEDSPINILAKGNVQRIIMPDGRIVLSSGSSIACAHITSILANSAIDKFNIQSALLYLKSKSKGIYTSKKSAKKHTFDINKIKNAVVFPFSKEAHAFLRFAEELHFNIQGYYDIRYSGKVGRKLSSYYESHKSDECIRDIEHIDFTGVDTIILGHLDELNAISKHDYRSELINKAITMHINIYSFDPLDQYVELLNDSDINYFFPQITTDEIPHNTFGKLFKINKPIVGIFGTSSRQGKFSLQIILKSKLESKNYVVGTIGTEPHSLLFNFDEVFPMGYNNTVYLQHNEIVLYLNNTINTLCKRDKDIILAASQSQTIPFYCNNLLEFPPMQYHFALGLKPDAIILCINYYDEIAYIRNTIYTLAGLTDAVIIAFVMYPLTYSEETNRIYGNSKRKITALEFKQKADILLNEFKVPTFMLGEQQDMSELCQAIIDFF